MATESKKAQRDSSHLNGLATYVGLPVACSECVYSMPTDGNRVGVPRATRVVPTSRGRRQLCDMHAAAYVVPRTVSP